ncbi:hypothetical protein XPA_006308 [Xanthoria parietina]
MEPKNAMTEEALKNNGGGHLHWRSRYAIVRGAWWDTHYGNWTDLPFCYGPNSNKITRRVQHNLCIDGNEFRDREKGGSYRVFFMTMPMPTKEERWVWIDVNFALSRTVKFWHGEGHFKDVETDAVLGLKRDEERTLGCRNRGASIPDPGLSESYSDKPDISWLAVANGNYGLDLTWQPPQKSTWQENFIKNVLTIGTGYIPGVGPILQIMFPVGWTLISEEDPEAAFALLRNLCPSIDLTDKVIGELRKAAAAETREFLPDGWKELNLRTQQQAVEAVTTPRPIEPMDAMLPMMLQKEVLDATGNSPDKDTPGGKPRRRARPS